MTAYYAIGDIHGEEERLAALHEAILEHAARNNERPSIVHLGDYIDRGPESRGVIERIIKLQQRGDCDVIAIKGNHEALMLSALDSLSPSALRMWHENGAAETIESYERANGVHDDVRESIDRAHIAWLRNLPSLHHDTERRIAFVHGGIDPARFPECPDEVRLWTRSDKFFRAHKWPKREALDGLLVVHGHTPTRDQEPEISERRINVDTGVCYGGPLTCVVLAPNEPLRFLRA